MPRLRPIAVLVCAAALALPASAAATITEFQLPGAQSDPNSITAGPDGALWFTEEGSGLGAGSGKVGRITTSGTITEFPIPSPGSIPNDITTGPDGALWFTEFEGKIGRITTGGAATEFTVPGADRRPVGIASGPDGALWFADAFNSVGRVTTAGAFTIFPVPTTCCGATDITPGPDGALWFTEITPDFNGEVDRIATDGTITQHSIPPTTQPEGITLGPDGALWFTDSAGNSIGRLTTAGSFTRFPIRTPNSGPNEIVTGRDGALWFTESAVGKVGRITTAGDVTDFRTEGAPAGIARGPDGALWFTELAGNAIGRITTDQPLEDSVDGTLFTDAPCNPPELGCTKPRYVFGASSTASGEHGFGTVDYITGERAGLFVDPGTVSCLSVRGNRATVGVDFESRSALIFVEDNGPAGQDRFAVQQLTGKAPATCPAAPPAGVELGPGFPGANGSSAAGVVVTDAQAVPTTKADCRHGGYKRFGFRNQGRCIASVVRVARRAGP